MRESRAITEANLILHPSTNLSDSYMKRASRGAAADILGLRQSANITNSMSYSAKFIRTRTSHEDQLEND